MSGPPRVRPMNIAHLECRPVLAPAGNKTRPTEPRKAVSKPTKKSEKTPQDLKHKKSTPSSQPIAVPNFPQRETAPSLLRRQDSMTASCSSDASSSTTDTSSLSGRVGVRKKQYGLKREKVESVVGGADSLMADSIGSLESRKRCAWVTPTTDPWYAAFHDEEWGFPVHDDKRLFELLSLSGALAERTWPEILNKRNMFREVFLDFDPIAVSKLNEKKFVSPGSCASSLLSEVKLRAIIENAHQISKVIIEFGSFSKYIWNFVNHKSIVSQFRYPRQVPVKTPKAEMISKDLVKRGFRSVGPTVIYTFMQVAGLTNDHLISCFRFKECMIMPEAGEKDGALKS
ncbi:DNA-3-methyladenine glycosylase 1-like [Carya illinoinensis]|uniref:DNA-3-methyladenine glycosylase I n=1 Tax=Carya illinoinensis TaxID=32201 RepID=A0A8T1RD93_CARIL|nr:DNA-3-methyladenine glycosylase 1-like [Carya illinoinensis]KAG6665460.1 hypothetical protein CIPAW_02G162200 [Carya illinoinensis]